MTLTIGRLTLNSPTNVTDNHARLALWGAITHNTAGSADLARSKARQLGHLQGRVVPITWDSDPEVDGFYRIGNVNVTFEVDRTSAVLAKFQVQADVVQRGTAEIELMTVGGNLSDENGGSPERWAAPPVSAEAFRAGTYAAQTVTRASEDGDVTVYRNLPTDNPRYRVAPADYYDGAARIEVNGETVEFGPGATFNPADVILTNGLIESVRLLTDTNVLSANQYDGSAWTQAWRGNLNFGGSGHNVAGFSAEILRNDPVACTVRVKSQRQEDNYSEADFTVVRGSRILRISWRMAIFPDNMILEGDNDAGTDEGGWVERDGDDADGDRYVCGTADGYTARTADGGLTASPTVNPFHCYIGSIVDGSAAQAGDTGSDLYNQYLGTPSTKEIILPQ